MTSNEVKLIFLMCFVAIGLIASCRNEPKRDDEYLIKRNGRDLVIERNDGAFSVIIHSNTSSSYITYEIDGIPYIEMKHTIGTSEIDRVNILESSASKTHVFRTLESSGKVVGSYEAKAP